MKDIPEWVLKYRKKGTEIHVRKGGHYYLCKVSSKWNPEKKRARKITGEYLGKITQEGLIPPKYKRVAEKYTQISVKEYGASFFLQSISEDIVSFLKKHYPYEWKELIVFSIFRLTDKAILKNLGSFYHNSYLSETYTNVRVSHKFLGGFMKDIGMRREQMVSFMREFFVDTEYAIVDLTNVFSRSKSVISAMLGKNKDDVYITQVNLLLIYSLDKMQPFYFRMLNGSIRDVSSIIKTVHESSIQEVVFIGDKGIHSDDNIKVLREYSVDYILPLRRNSNYIDYSKIESKDREKFDGYLIYNKRMIWFYSTEIGSKEKVITYLDTHLKSEEENDLSLRIKRLNESEELSSNDKKKLEKYKNRLYKDHQRNGTLSVRTNLEKSPEKVYELIKSRIDVEQAFDTFKNTLDGDRTYARDDNSLEGWMFINFIALQIYYKIYAKLIEKNLLSKYSPMDVIIGLKRVFKLKVSNEYLLGEIPKKSREIIERLNINIPITKNS